MVTSEQLRKIANTVEYTNKISAYDYATVCRALAESIDRLAGATEDGECTCGNASQIG